MLTTYTEQMKISSRSQSALQLLPDEIILTEIFLNVVQASSFMRYLQQAKHCLRMQIIKNCGK